MKIETLKNDDLDFCAYSSALEKEWRHSRPRFTSKELLSIFPEAKAIIPQKINEWQHQRDLLRGRIKKKLAVIQANAPNENARIFWREWLMVTDGETLLEITAHIKRLNGLMLIAQSRTPNNWISEEQKEQALAVPLETLLQQSFRRSGKTLTGLCPLHKERSPSFCIYPETNTFHCFGCSQNGDSIALMQKLHGYSFKDAVINLIGQ
jgi:hypothetical protein